MKPARRAATLVLSLGLALAACGGESPSTAPAPDAAVAPAKGAREVIAPDFEAKIRVRELARRGEPLDAGDVVQGIEALPAGAKRVVVFYRGHW